jgi:HEAT repeat protein
VVVALAELGTGTPQARAAREFVEECLRDPDFRVRSEAAAALARIGLPEAAPAIERALAGELDGRSRRRMNDALRDLRDGSRPTEQARALREEVERLRGETSRLRERLEKVEARLLAAAAPTSTPPAPGEAPAGHKTKRPRPVARRRR